MRRHAGISSLSAQSDTLASYSSLSTAISTQQLTSLQSQLTTFQTALRTFATKHRAKILSDPVFRTHFSDMCNQLGVDPLGSGGRKGVWDYLGVGEWTYALAVQVVDVCLQTRERNGGVIEMDELIRGVTRLRGGGLPPQGMQQRQSAAETSVTPQDIARAIEALEPLGCGYKILTVGNRKLVRSIAAEFDTDSMTVLEAVTSTGRGHITVSGLRGFTASKRGPSAAGWSDERARNAIEKAVMEDGLLWLDDGQSGELLYWMPSLFDFQELAAVT